MKQEEGSAFWTRVLPVQLFDSLLGQPQQRFVLRQRFFDGVAKISEQTEVEVVIPICQEADFQCLDQVLDVLSAREHRRNHHQSSNSWGILGKIHARQRARRRQQRRQPVHQG